MRSSNAKALAAIVLTGVGSAFVLGFRTADDLAIDATGGTVTGTDGGSAANAGATGSSGTGSGATGSGATGSGSSGASAGTTDTGSSGTAGTASAAYADGTWTGTAVSEPWGDFQVQVVVSGGTITDVTVIESPSDRHSSRINSQVVPILTSEALQAQSASVDMVSGATWTSDSYATSLQSALDEAAQAA